jgi:hypothetical protein
VGDDAIDPTRRRAPLAHDEPLAASAPQPASSASGAARTAQWIDLAHHDDGAAAAAARASGTPNGFSDALKATDEDALRLWTDPKYAEQRRAADEKKDLDKLAADTLREIGKQEAEDRMALLQVRPPEPVLAVQGVGGLVIPIAQLTRAVAGLVPYLGDALDGAELNAGRDLGGLGFPLTEKERDDRIERLATSAALLAAGPLLRGGIAGARAIRGLARSLGRSLSAKRAVR